MVLSEIFAPEESQIAEKSSSRAAGDQQGRARKSSHEGLGLLENCIEPSSRRSLDVDADGGEEYRHVLKHDPILSL